MEKYRIIQYSNGLFAVQKKKRLFGFGPKMWYTYVEWPDHYSGDPGFTLIRSFGETYEYLDDAIKIIKREKKRDNYRDNKFNKYKVVEEI